MIVGRNVIALTFLFRPICARLFRGSRRISRSAPSSSKVLRGGMAGGDDEAGKGQEDATTFVDLILNDHSELRELLDKLGSAVAAGDITLAKQILLQFQVWEERHFATEENAMRSFGFPDYEAHRDHHGRPVSPCRCRSTRRWSRP